jgi:hypothetical protein
LLVLCALVNRTNRHFTGFPTYPFYGFSKEPREPEEEEEKNRQDYAIFYNRTRIFGDAPKTLKTFLDNMAPKNIVKDIVKDDTRYKWKIELQKKEIIHMTTPDWSTYMVHSLIHASSIGATWFDILPMLETPSPYIE